MVVIHVFLTCSHMSLQNAATGAKKLLVDAGRNGSPGDVCNILNRKTLSGETFCFP